MAAVTNYYKFSGLKEHIYSLTFLEVTGLKWIGRTVFFLEALRESLCPCLLQLLEAACIPWRGLTHAL